MKRQIFKLMRANSVKIVKQTIRFTKRNSNWILSALSILGITGLTWSAIKGTIKAVKVCEEKEVKDKKEILKTTWKIYIPTVGLFLLTTVTILGNAKLNAKKLATMTGLYAMSQADALELRKKVKEMIGPKKAKDIEAELEKERMKNEEPPKEDEVMKTGHGNKLYRDWLTGQWFRACPEYIEAVNADMNLTLHSEVDNIMYRRYYSEKLCLRENGMDDCFWDLYDMRNHGYNKIDLDCTHTQWVEINGEREMACTVRCIPEVSGVE